MTNAEKLTTVKTLLESDGIVAGDALLNTYLDLAKNEILQWKYSYTPDAMPNEVPAEYEMVQIYAVIAGYSQSGAEGQLVSVENGINRHWKYESMVTWIRSHVIPNAKVK